jgi:hypothetical protein
VGNSTGHFWPRGLASTPVPLPEEAGRRPRKAGMQIHESLRSRQDDGGLAVGTRPPGSFAANTVTDLYYPFLRFPRRAA